MTVISPWLFSVRRRRNPVAHMLTPDPDGITAPQAGVEQNIAPDPFSCAERPAFVVGLGVGLGPFEEARPLLALGIGNTLGRIDGDVLGRLGPFEQATHGVEEIARLCRRRCAAVARFDQMQLA